jgi:hypothetical protein
MRQKKSKAIFDNKNFFVKKIFPFVLKFSYFWLKNNEDLFLLLGQKKQLTDRKNNCFVNNLPIVLINILRYRPKILKYCP